MQGHIAIGALSKHRKRLIGVRCSVIKANHAAVKTRTKPVRVSLWGWVATVFLLLLCRFWARLSQLLGRSKRLWSCIGLDSACVLNITVSQDLLSWSWLNSSQVKSSQVKSKKSLRLQIPCVTKLHTNIKLEQNMEKVITAFIATSAVYFLTAYVGKINGGAAPLAWTSHGAVDKLRVIELLRAQTPQDWSNAAERRHCIVLES